MLISSSPWLSAKDFCILNSGFALLLDLKLDISEWVSASYLCDYLILPSLFWSLWLVCISEALLLIDLDRWLMISIRISNSLSISSPWDPVLSESSLESSPTELKPKPEYLWALLYLLSNRFGSWSKLKALGLESIFNRNSLLTRLLLLMGAAAPSFSSLESWFWVIVLIRIIAAWWFVSSLALAPEFFLLSGLSVSYLSGGELLLSALEPLFCPKTASKLLYIECLAANWFLNPLLPAPSVPILMPELLLMLPPYSKSRSRSLTTSCLVFSSRYAFWLESLIQCSLSLIFCWISELKWLCTCSVHAEFDFSKS